MSQFMHCTQIYQNLHWVLKSLSAEVQLVISVLKNRFKDFFFIIIMIKYILPNFVNVIIHELDILTFLNKILI